MTTNFGTVKGVKNHPTRCYVEGISKNDWPTVAKHYQEEGYTIVRHFIEGSAVTIVMDK